MFKKILALFILGIMLFTEENAMAETALNAKQKSIATVASYAARGSQNGLKQALIEGLDAGVSVNEFKEILVQTYAYCGFPRSLNALNTLMQVTEERGNKDEKGKLPSAKPEGNSLDYGTENQTKLVGRPVEGKIYEFAPAIDEFLKAHLFGDIFARDNVDWQTRELATIAMLASMNNVTAQLNSHINVGKHNGLTDEQVTEILEIANKTGTETILFGLGEENTAYAKYFIGKSYLQPMTELVPQTLRLNPNAAIIGIFITKPDRLCLLFPAAAGIRNGENRHRSLKLEILLIFRKVSNIGTARQKTAGLRILQFQFPTKEPRLNGLSQLRMKNTTN